MISFTEHILLEGVNKHITHLEDLFIEQGYSGGVYATRIVDDLISNFESLANTSKLSVSLKWDGSPAVIVGTDPKSGQHFVASKSLFNKTPKINFNYEDIDRNHSGGLNPILKLVLKNTAKSDFAGGIYQGDVMFFPSILSKEKIDGESNWIFTPNTLTYAVPVDSKLGKKISKSKIGIAFHTKYTGNDISNLSASYGIDAEKEIRSQNELLVLNSVLPSAPSGIGFGKVDMTRIKTGIKNIKSLLSKNKSYLNKLHKEKNFYPLFKQYINYEVRNNSTSLSIDRLSNFISIKFQDKKTKASFAKRDSLLVYIQSNKESLSDIFEIHSLFYTIKMYILHKFNQIESMRVFIKKDGEFKVTNPEGYVAVDQKGNVIKLVDRLVFSRLNFKK